MNLPVQHLNDEAIAACADGVLPAGARLRAERHLALCPGCSDAVRGQREAMKALRTSAAPALPSDLLDRLRSLPMTTPLRMTPVVIGDGGAQMFPAYGTSALEPAAGGRERRGRFGSRSMMLAGATTALAVGFVGAGVGPVAAQDTERPPAQREVVRPAPAAESDASTAVTTAGMRVLVATTERTGAEHAGLRAEEPVAGAAADRLPGAR